MQTEVGHLEFAGTDTTSSTLTYLFWELSKPPEQQNEWAEELQKDVSDCIDALSSFRQIPEPPVLDDVVHETFGVLPAASANLQRETPAEVSDLTGHVIAKMARESL